uniref:Splicing factor, arginine/serine-rich 19 n=1 Tax=Nicotiana tabacum TaxID=4097 RepID=A0A1S4CCN5_TOBAC|nr:PREDICTED: splicing factor, arginine/serine-rich 19-like [Nicotiana tabacum]
MTFLHICVTFAADVTFSTLSSRNRSPRSVSDKDSPRSVFLDRSSSSNSRRSSSGTSSKHPYSSFNRSHRDKNREREKERSGTVDLWDHDSSDPLGNILAGRVDKNSLRRSQSLVSRRPGELLPRRTEDLKGGISSTHNSGTGIHSGGSSFNGSQKAAFEKDFPSLGIEERQVTRVSSPGLSSAVQSLPIGNSALLGADKWTSALAEVPPIIGSISMGSSASQHSIAAAPPSASSGMASLNMAEALSQAPPRARATTQIPDKTQRLEELAIKQSRQLIPVIPSTPKALVSSSADKAKQPKATARANEMVGLAKSMQQPFSTQLANQPRSGQVRSEAPATSHGKTLLVLKPGRENGVTSLSKEALSPANNTGGRLANCSPAVAPSAPALTSPTSRVTSLESKAATLSLKARSTAEKRSSLSQAQSRSDFFNLMRKKTSLNSSTVLPDSGMASSDSSEQSGIKTKDEDSASLSPCVSENGSERTSNGDAHESQNDVQRHNGIEENNLSINGALYPDEEEAAFLRSLGWDENAGEDEGLTEEEINAFYQEYMKLKPSLKVYKGALPKCLMLPEMHVATNRGPASSESTSSESDA